MEVKTLLLVSLGAVLGVRTMAGGHLGRSMPGAPINVSRDDHDLQQVVLAAAYSFNNQSNDAFLFKASAVLRAQRQVVRGLRYIVDLDISRTVCPKRQDNQDLSRCLFQPPGRLQQTFQCHTEVWLIPWQTQIRTLVLVCKP
ncbi:cystatin-F [Mugil cephalus]|uniref:cystatin-F n=1 Tax=Mugil cephalus TaxID=48193 RepID=UPI001FB5B845|nr:cystatin-F [Mugil cephalus]